MAVRRWWSVDKRRAFNPAQWLHLHADLAQPPSRVQPQSSIASEEALEQRLAWCFWAYIRAQLMEEAPPPCLLEQAELHCEEALSSSQCQKSAREEGLAF